MIFFSGQNFQIIMRQAGIYFLIFVLGLENQSISYYYYFFICLLNVSKFSEHAELSKVSITGRRDLWC